MFAEHEAIKREASLPRSLIEGAKGSSQEEGEVLADDDDARGICTVVPHELEHVEEGDEEQAEQQETDADRKRQSRPTLACHIWRTRRSITSTVNRAPSSRR